MWAVQLRTQLMALLVQLTALLDLGQLMTQLRARLVQTTALLDFVQLMALLVHLTAMKRRAGVAPRKLMEKPKYPVTQLPGVVPAFIGPESGVQLI